MAKQLANKDRKAFINWLENRGAEILVPTASWEWVRFRAHEKIHIVYIRKTGALS